MSLSIFLTAYFWLFLGFAIGFTWAPIAGSFIPGLGGSRDFSQVRFWIAWILRRGYDGGNLRVIHDKSGRVLSFRKYILGKGDYGLELCCAAPDWSDEERQKVRSLAQDRGLSHRHDSGAADGAGTDALVVDCGQDTAAAYDLAAAAWAKIFGLSLEARHRAESSGYSDLDELIDGPDHPPPVRDVVRNRGRRHVQERFRKAGVPSITMVILAMLLALLLLVSAVGLPISILLSRGEAPDWSIQFETMTLGGGTTGLVFFVILAGSYLAIRRLPLGSRRWARPFDTWEKRIYITHRSFAFTLPFAVLLVWAGF